MNVFSSCHNPVSINIYTNMVNSFEISEQNVPEILRYIITLLHQHPQQHPLSKLYLEERIKFQLIIICPYQQTSLKFFDSKLAFEFRIRFYADNRYNVNSIPPRWTSSYTFHILYLHAYSMLMVHLFLSPSSAASCIE